MTTGTDALACQEQLMRQAREQAALARLHRLLGREPAAPAAQPVGVREVLDRERLQRALGCQPADPVTARKRVILQREIHWLLVENDPAVAELARRAEREIGAFVPRVRGRACTRADLARLLEAADPQLRRAAWYADEPLGRHLTGLLRELVTRREERAAEQAGASFSQLVMARREVDLAWVEARLEELEQRTRGPYGQLLAALAERRGVAQPRPWDLDYLATPEGPPAFPIPSDALRLVREGYQRLGVDLAAADFQLHEVPDLPLPAMCIVVRAPGDVHILWRGGGGGDAARVLAHELAHALAAATATVDYLLTLESPVLDEGVADAFAHWIEVMARPPGDAPAPSRRFAALLRLRRHLLHARVELDLYQRPGCALPEAYAQAHQRFLLCLPDEPCERFAARGLLYGQPFQPVVYLLADMVAAQVAAAAPVMAGGAPAATGPWVTAHFWEEAGLRPWRRKLARATGQDLSSQPLLAQLGFTGWRQAGGYRPDTRPG